MNYNKNTIDTRQLRKRLSELEALEEKINEAKEALAEAQAALANLGDTPDKSDREEAQKAVDEAADALQDAIDDLDTEQENPDELEDLRNAENQVGQWSSGNTLIREGYWTEYVKELVRDVGDLPDKLPWYLENNIYWAGVASDLLSDYSQITICGETFLYRVS